MNLIFLNENFLIQELFYSFVQAIKMLLMVVLLFALCWLPLQSYYVLQTIFPVINE